MFSSKSIFIAQHFCEMQLVAFSQRVRGEDQYHEEQFIHLLCTYTQRLCWLPGNLTPTTRLWEATAPDC